MHRFLTVLVSTKNDYIEEVINNFKKKIIPAMERRIRRIHQQAEDGAILFFSQNLQPLLVAT